MEPVSRAQSVCRNLFGAVDQDLLRRELKQRLRDISEEDNLRWNFNFQTETPLPGRFEWEELSADCVAAHYQESAPLQDALCRPDSEEEDGEEGRTGTDQVQDQENCSSMSNTPTCPAEVTPVRRKRARANPVGKPNNNARITDFFAKRRRSTETKSFKNHFHTNSSESAACKTIR